MSKVSKSFLHIYRYTKPRTLVFLAGQHYRYIIMYAGGPILLSTKYEPVVSLSTAESEFIAVSECFEGSIVYEIAV
ncbi:hypothetical protein PR048_012462 [Dryococelus australis]|uniref:Uncharacterized protein n=1 Tax=Dryococelus australis TaxID=614101 RepID=A0ABQ9HQU7_9NEOP|nr:hypothetical protein PR048_012462 [Dryococelus australis]